MFYLERPDCRLSYRIDDFTNPWESPSTVLMIHGLAESSVSWRSWVPYLARDWKVLRPDLRGYGASTPMPSDFHWSLDIIIDDVISLLDHVGIEKVHVVGAKVGGTLAMKIAARHPQRVHSLCAVGAPVSLRPLEQQASLWRTQIREEGVKPWLASTMRGRLGNALPEVAVDWWTELMAKTASSTLEGFLKMVPTVDAADDLPAIKCRTLIITTTKSPLGSVDDVKQWQQKIARSELAVIDGDSYHVAASAPDECAKIVRSFIKKGEASANKVD